MSHQDKQGHGECQLEVDFVDEADLEERFKSCSKYPGHKQFLPMKSLNLGDLPEHLRTVFTLDFIHHVAQLTVKLTVNFISHDRPCKCEKKTLSRERSCECLWGNVRHVGSGLVTRLAGPDQLAPDARDSTKTYFIMVTAAHVLFDTSEAQKTEIEFFYDDPHDRSSVRKAFGLRVLNTNLEADFSEVLCLTEDHVISEKLDELIRKRNYKRDLLFDFRTLRPYIIRLSSFDIRRNTLQDRYQSSAEQEMIPQDLAVHISHPYGTSKKVTLGNIVSADTSHGHHQLIYRLATCRGSSGGPVCVIPTEIHDTKHSVREFIYSVPHSRHHGNELNSSSSWTVYFYDHYDLTDTPKSTVEDKKKMKQTSVRLSLLDIEDLPLGYRLNHYLHLIKYLSKFTIGVHVLNVAKFDSENMASGFVIRLANNDDIKPELEDKIKTYFIVITAAHVISDTSQAKETEINFFCDDLQDMSSVRKAFGLRVLNSNIEFNFSEVLCVTKDHVISSMLKEHFLKLSTIKPQSRLSQYASTLNKCLTGSLVLSTFTGDCFTFTNEMRKRLLFEVYMSLNSAFERLVLITLFKDIDSFASDIFLRIYEETYYSSRSVTSQSDVLDYVTFLCKFLTDKPGLKDKCLSAYSNKNKEDLIECIKHTSQELYCEIMLREKHKITFQISHHGTKEISFDIPYLSDDVREVKRRDVHDDSTVFTMLRTVSCKDDTVETNVSGITLRLHKCYFELSNKTLQTDGTTISFPRYVTGPIHPIGF